MTRLETALFLVDNLLHVGRFGFRVGHGGWREVTQEFV